MILRHALDKRVQNDLYYCVAKNYLTHFISLLCFSLGWRTRLFSLKRVATQFPHSLHFPPWLSSKIPGGCGELGVC